MKKNYVIKILKEMVDIYARLINQYKFKYQVLFPSRLDEQDGGDQILDDVELYIKLNTNRAWSFDKTFLMTTYF